MNSSVYIRVFWTYPWNILPSAAAAPTPPWVKRGSSTFARCPGESMNFSWTRTGEYESSSPEFQPMFSPAHW